MKEGSPEYVKKKKKVELEAKLAVLREDLKEITIDTGPHAANLAAPDTPRVPEDARRRDDLTAQIAALEKEIAELDNPDEKAA